METLIKVFGHDTVTCRPIPMKRIDEHVSWDTKMRDVESWKPTRFRGINRCSDKNPTGKSVAVELRTKSETSQKTNASRRQD
jgi:hypothetical protein